MKTKKSNNVLIAIMIALLALTAAVFAKILSPEDVWLCQNGQWVEHGNPSAEMPSESCQ